MINYSEQASLGRPDNQQPKEHSLITSRLCSANARIAQEGEQIFADDVSHDNMRSEQHENYKLYIPKSLSSDNAQLLECQKAILRAGSKRHESGIQRVHIAGWFEAEPPMALMFLRFPPPLQKRLQSFPHFPLSYVYERGHLTDAVVLADVNECVDLDIGEYCIQFAELDAPYQSIIDR
jgi:hypothetical protein